MKKENMYNLSVIIPIYNTEKYLHQCLDSVLIILNSNSEIILVDDGSTDLSPFICDEYASKDKRIKVIHKENGGPSDARNIGLELAIGEYIIFLDSDDYWQENVNFDALMKSIEENKLDMLIFFSRKYFQNSNEFYRSMPIDMEGQLIMGERTKTLELMCTLNPFPSSGCTKIVNRQLIQENNLIFRKGLLSEDVDWLFKLLKSCKQIGIAYSDFYIYRQQRKNSITNSMSDKHINDIYCIIIFHLKRIKAEITNELERNALLSLLAYEYSILLGMLLNIKNKKMRMDLYREAIELKWLLKYDLNPKVRMIRRVSNILGIRLSISILNIFLKLKQKSIIK